MKKVLSVRVRDSVYHGGHQTIAAKDCSKMEFHPAGVLLALKGKGTIVVPFSNILWVEVDGSGA